MENPEVVKEGDTISGVCRKLNTTTKVRYKKFLHAAMRHWVTEEEEHNTAMKDPQGILSGDLADIYW
jgi:hypothetical protein